MAGIGSCISGVPQGFFHVTGLLLQTVKLLLRKNDLSLQLAVFVRANVPVFELFRGLLLRLPQDVNLILGCGDLLGQHLLLLSKQICICRVELESPVDVGELLACRFGLLGQGLESLAKFGGITADLDG